MQISFQHLEYLGQQCICNNYNKKVFFRFLVKFLRFPVLSIPPFRICDDIPAFRRLLFGVCHLHIASWCVVVTEAKNSVAQLTCVLIFCPDGFVPRSHQVSVPLLTTYCIYISFIYLIFRVPRFRIWGDFLRFHVLGFGVIFRDSLFQDLG